MKYFKHKSLLAGFVLAAPLGVMAQVHRNTDTTFKTQSLNIYSTYKPEVAPAPKPEFVPSLPVIDTAKPRFSYMVPQQTLSYSYRAEPIKPLAMKQQKETLPFENYIKLGIGNIKTYLIDAGVGGIYGDNYDLNLHFNHLSQEGDRLYQKWSQNELNVGGSYYFPKHTLNVQLTADRRAYRQYGYDTAIYHYDENRVKQVYSGIDLKASLAPSTAAFWSLKYAPSVNLYALSNSRGATERALGLSLPFSKTIDSTFVLSLALNANLTQYDDKNKITGNSFLQLAPSIDLNFQKTKIHLGVKPTWAKEDKVYLLPDLTLETVLAKNSLRLLAGWTSELNQNSYKMLSTWNPYMRYQYTPVQGTTNHVFGGFDASLNSHLQIGGTIGYKWWNNMAMFTNNYTDSTDGRQFNVIYDKVSAVNVEAKIAYQVHTKFSLNASSTWNFYDVKSTQPKAWHLPQISIAGGFNWSPVSKLNIGAGVTIYDKMFANNADGTYRKLPMIVDLNANISYTVIPRLNLFVQANNLLNQRYQLWNQYPSYGINVLGGIRFKF